MSLPKILGTETEYGITVKNSETFDPISHSTLIVNSYQEGQNVQIIWDYEEEEPFVDARGFKIDHKVETPKRHENITINKILDNGARFYVDHAHPEFSTPECSNPRDVVIYEKAGEHVLNHSLVEANTHLPAHQQMLVYKNNSDYKGNSYGYHENYLVDRHIPFERICRYMTTFLVTRQIFTGAGKVGAENNTEAAPFQITQRADFFETEIGLDTMLNRPIINTRDEPHADRKKYRRLHVITGDVNMSEYSTYLKVGTTALVLQMIEDECLQLGLTLKNPVTAMHQVSRDLKCVVPLELDSGQRYTAIEIQREFLTCARRYAAAHAGDAVTNDILEKWEYVLDCLEVEPKQLHRELDWVIKEYLLSSYCEKHRCDWNDPRVMMVDLQYHDIRPEKSLYYLLQRQNRIERIVDDREILDAINQPPVDTRAYFRGQCLKKYRSAIYGVSWGAISFDAGDSTVKRILMPEPGKGTRTYVQELLERSQTVEELLTNIMS
ncbi:proteasome accessory factor PafA2 [candidate division KSB3 bacterium]|uniref:Proteasome accessory factor PafA2 n=1 Tax=candidate division KSB3 bacterium TaxID=2044937 RepID=A0A2G6KAS0_9BACT|nr:MAG: proteasome accessory factor PafA2 [candidate division KSB3 bacterium]